MKGRKSKCANLRLGQQALALGIKIILPILGNFKNEITEG